MSGSETGTVSVLVTAVESFVTNQTLLLLVKVRNLLACYRNSAAAYTCIIVIVIFFVSDIFIENMC